MCRSDSDTASSLLMTTTETPRHDDTVHVSLGDDDAPGGDDDATWHGGRGTKATASAALIVNASECPYLDSVRRAVLDFDFEKQCSLTLSSQNVYSCLVCGKMFSGRGKNTPAYVHSLHENHHLFLKLDNESVYETEKCGACLGDVVTLTVCCCPIPVDTAFLITMRSLDRHLTIFDRYCGQSFLRRYCAFWIFLRNQYIKVGVLVVMAVTLMQHRYGGVR